MAKKSRIIGADQAQAPRYTKKQMEDAASDARDVTAQSKIVQACLTSMIVSRRLYMVARSALDNELEHGWEVDNLPLVIQTLVMSAQEKANEKFPMMGLQQDLFQTVIPFIDIVVRQEADDAAAARQKEEETPSDEVLSGSDDDTEAGLGELHHGAGGDEVVEAGVDSEGDRREEAEAGDGSGDDAGSGDADGSDATGRSGE